MLQRHAANLIKVAAVLTAIPRWVVALLSAEGLTLPAEWRGGWIVFSALSAVGMAIVEGVAFAYVFNAWRQCKQTEQGRVLVGLAAFSAVLFVVLLTPSIAANVRGLTLGAWIINDMALTAWGMVVAASTISIVASIGYAEKTRQVTETPKFTAPLPQVSVSLPELSTASFPQLSEPAKTWRQLSEAERAEVVELSVDEITSKYNVSERTARNWRAH